MIISMFVAHFDVREGTFLQQHYTRLAPFPTICQPSASIEGEHVRKSYHCKMCKNKSILNLSSFLSSGYM